MNLTKKISIIVPILNEEGNIIEFYNRTVKILNKIKIDYEIIFCDNRSNDNSRNIIRDLANKDQNVKGVFLSKNFGHQPNLRSGLSIACGDAAITLDGDLQDPPELIEKIYDEYLLSFKSENKKLDIINTYRLERKGEPFLRLFFIKSYYILCKIFISDNIHYNTGDYRLYSKRIYKIINNEKSKNIFLRSYVNELGFNSKAIGYVREPRGKNKSKMNLLNLFKFGLDGIISSSNRLLRFISLVSFILIVVSFIIIFSSSSTVINNGYLLFMVLSFFLIAISILSEYMANLYNEIRRKPAFIIDEIVGKK